MQNTNFIRQILYCRWLFFIRVEIVNAEAIALGHRQFVVSLPRLSKYCSGNILLCKTCVFTFKMAYHSGNHWCFKEKKWFYHPNVFLDRKMAVSTWESRQGTHQQSILGIRINIIFSTQNWHTFWKITLQSHRSLSSENNNKTCCLEKELEIYTNNHEGVNAFVIPSKEL